MPRRVTSSEPASDASANNAAECCQKADFGRVQMESSRIIAITGGTARIVRRRPLPASQSNATAVQKACRGKAIRVTIGRRRGGNGHARTITRGDSAVAKIEEVADVSGAALSRETT